MIDRRKFMGSAGAASLLAASGASPQAAHPPVRGFWERIAADFDTSPDLINLEHGYWTQMSRPVLKRFQAHTRRTNAQHSYYARRNWHEDRDKVEARLAGYLRCKPSELALTRNASEALQALIGGYRHLGEGDAVLYSDLDYPSVQTDFDSLARARGADVVKLAIPEPVTHDGLIDFYDRALEANPKVRLMVLTHVSNKTGLAVPVREITARAKARGVDVIVDAAHSWGQMDFTVDEIDADFVAFNLHKWIGAPLGVGFLYIRESRLDAIARNISQGPDMEEKTAGRVYTGTMNFAAVLSVQDALDYCDRVGWTRKARRFRTLRNAWASEARKLDHIEVLTPEDERLHAGITSFRLAGRGGDEENAALARHLLDEHGIFTVHRTGIANGACIRVTPSLANLEADSERLLAALKTLPAYLSLLTRKWP